MDVYFLGCQVHFQTWRQQCGVNSFLLRAAAVMKEIKQHVMTLGLKDHFRNLLHPSVHESSLSHLCHQSSCDVSNIFLLGLIISRDVGRPCPQTIWRGSYSDHGPVPKTASGCF